MGRASIKSLIAVALFFLSFSGNVDERYSARTVGVTDGDSITILIAGNRQLKIRLAEIDAPERDQPFGTKSKQALSDLVFGETISVQPITIDRYGRTVARLYFEGLDVNAAMIEQGAAWVYTAYSDDPLFPQLQAAAKAEGRGLWGLSEYEQIPPWEWRRGRRASVPTDTGLEKYNCATKTYCREMTSCDEARWYLKECGLTRLDGDGDGIPCERMCR